jgi:hypothetical protein
MENAQLFQPPKRENTTKVRGSGAGSHSRLGFLAKRMVSASPDLSSYQD